jgi:hypothetical protein
MSAERKVETLWRRIGTASDAFNPAECRNVFKRADLRRSKQETLGGVQPIPCHGKKSCSAADEPDLWSDGRAGWARLLRRGLAPCKKRFAGIRTSGLVSKTAPAQAACEAAGSVSTA